MFIVMNQPGCWQERESPVELSVGRLFLMNLDWNALSASL